MNIDIESHVDHYETCYNYLLKLWSLFNEIFPLNSFLQICSVDERK